MTENGKIQYNGKEYPIAMNFNVIEKLQEEFHSFSEWAEELLQAEPRAKAIKFGLWAMINEGIDIEREKGSSIEPLTIQQVGRLVTEMGVSKVTEKMRQTVSDSVGGDEDEGKNE